MTYEYIVRFGGDCQVRAFRREALLCHRWRCCCGRCDLGLHRHEQRGAGCQEEDHDGRWRMYLPRGCSSGSPSLLRSLNEQRTVIPYGSRTKRQSVR